MPPLYSSNSSTLLRFILLLSIGCLSSFISLSADANMPLNFGQAKARAIKIHQKSPSTFYCGCPIKWEGKKGVPQLKSCGYSVRTNKERASRIEWEHVVPAAHLGYQLKCWKDGGRKNCAKDERFQILEGDIHNMQPAIGEINADRNNFAFSQWNGGERQYGRCEMKVDFKNKIVEPPNRAKGAIARTYFYMRDTYQITLSRQQTQLFAVWDKRFPPSKWECQRDNAIAAVQGNHNPYIQRACR